jgi:hypothetical protein
MVNVLAGLLLMQSLATGQGPTLRAAEIHPHEAAWLAARLIVEGEIRDFSADKGASISVGEVHRGEAGPALYLCDTQRASFLDSAGTPLVAFIDSAEGGCATLVFPPGAGGVLWRNTSALAAIAAAHESPGPCLESGDDRTRLAAAWFLIRDPDANLDSRREPLLRAALWGLARESHETNQAGLEVLRALGVEVGNYHPNYRPEIKREIAGDLHRRLFKENQVKEN